MDDVPHIGLPIRLAGVTYATVQQDTDDEVTATVTAIASFPIGWREEAPEFGVTPMEFQGQPLDTTDLEQACETWEPRARIRIVDRSPGSSDPTAARLQIEVSMFTAEDE
jgi:phage baseplate assembly protein W